MHFANGGVLDGVRDQMTKTAHLSKTLIKASIPRVPFDASKKEHRDAYIKFRSEGKWDISFKVEPPFKDVLRMIEIRLINYALEAK